MGKNSIKYLLEFGNNLRKQRVAQSLSQKQLAFETRLTREFINRIENGRVNISLTNIIEIANVLDVSPKELMKFDL